MKKKNKESDREILKCRVLLLALILHYHGLDEDEKVILEDFVLKNNAKKELDWSMVFISEDFLSASDRVRMYLKNIFLKQPPEEVLDYLIETWELCSFKGYVTETESNAMIKFARDWDIDKIFFKKFKS